MPSDPKSLVHIKIDAYGESRDDAIRAVGKTLQHFASGFNGGHGRTSDGLARYVVQYDDGSEE